MSNSALKVLAGAGATEDPVYVDDVFSTFVYTGDTSSSRTITNGIDLSGEGGLVWVKHRALGNNHFLVDTVRGGSKTLYSNATSAESTDTSGITGFTSSGFTIGNGNEVGQNNQPIASWTFRKQPGFFDVVTYTPSGSPTNVSHNLGSTPGMIIIKNLSDSRNWAVWHRSLSSVSGGESGGSQSTLKLNKNDAIAGTGYIQSPTSTQFTVSGSAETGTSSQNYVAYLFAHDAQDFGENSDEAIIKCGYYTGNTSTKPDIDLGFEPQFVLIKCATHSEDWIVLDSMRGIVTPDASGVGADASIAWNSYNAESSSSSTSYIELHANGFKLTGTGGQINAASRDYIYMAIRRPHKPASEFAATDLYNSVAGRSDSVSPSYVLGFPPDMGIQKAINGSSDGHYIFSRLTGPQYMFTNSTSAEATGTSIAWDYMNGMMDYFSSAAYHVWGFRRAPGFFDVVTYTGTNAALTVNHNLGVKPEMIIAKTRNNIRNWGVIFPSLSNTHDYAGDFAQAYLQLTNSFYDRDYSSSAWLTQDVTDTTITYAGNSSGGNADVNYAGWTYVNYLFASVPGISKIGTYTGTGSNVNVDCGFSAGARFVILKRTDGSGDWYLYDSLRGIVAGDDPYLLLNSTDAQVTNTDYIDPLSSGFTVTSSAPAALNNSGGKYIFYAIA